MKHLKILTALAIGVISSSSGMIQVGAVTYDFFVDFSTKEVANFNDFRQTFSVDTYDLDAQITWTWDGLYKFDSCPTPFTLNMNYLGVYRLNNVAPSFNFPTITLPDLVCTTSFTTYSASATFDLPDAIVTNIMNDDANFVRFFSFFQIPTPVVAARGRTLSLLGYRNYFDVTYDFNTTYLFNYFLSDQQFVSRTTTAGTGGTWTLTATQEVYLKYVYTTAGTDEYYINNSTAATIGTTRKKYAIDYNEEFFRGESVGAAFTADYDGTDTLLIGSTLADMVWQYNYYYLNTSNLAQAIVDAPIIGFTEEVCSGGFLDINVGCYVNNAFAYIVNDAPVISDAFTLLNTGIELAAQTFGIIGNFSDDNVFGYLILVGFGFIAVKWFLKNDE